MSDENSLENNIQNWLAKEGYPLEFKVANIFRSKNFDTFQGRYVNDFKTGLPREIDVVADTTIKVAESFLRISYVIECKWSGDKPWVIFTDKNSRISPGACIVQSISTKTAEAILWHLSDNKELRNLSIFHTPERPGFNGRQAFGSQNDLVYSTLQSIMSACYSEKKDYEVADSDHKDSLSFGVLIIPIVVIDGKLFESYYDDSIGDMSLKERKMIRLHWKGSEAWQFHSTIDIVTFDHLPEYVKSLAPETSFLIQKMARIYSIINDCLVKKTLTPLDQIIESNITKNNIHPILRHLINIENFNPSGETKSTNRY